MFAVTEELNPYLKCRKRLAVKGLIYYVGAERDLNLNALKRET
jgi:hypothetical protein